MPIAYTRDDARRRITTKATGTITVDDVLRFLDAQHAEGAWGYSVLADVREVTETTITAADTHTLAERVRKLSKEGKRGPEAFVASAPLIYGMTRMYGGLTGASQSVCVFAELAEAEEWLKTASRSDPD